jgi:hypothetical protein
MQRCRIARLIEFAHSQFLKLIAEAFVATRTNGQKRPIE